MRKVIRFWLFAVVASMLLPAACHADRYRVLDAALSMLEEGNPFLIRYNAETGAGIEPRFPLGCPYFWGGRDVEKILEPSFPAQSSDYYNKDLLYLYGLDCSGLTRWIVSQAGYARHDTISRLLNRSLYRDCVNYRAAKVAGEERAEALQVGDLLAVQHPSGGYHIAMYIGTLFDFGYTAETLPSDLAPYLYYPLLIHSTSSSDYYERYRLYLEKRGILGIQPPCGGVIVTLLDAPLSAAVSHTPEILDLSSPCFILEGYHLQITDLSQEKQTRWIRWRQRP